MKTDTNLHTQTHRGSEEKKNGCLLSLSSSPTVPSRLLKYPCFLFFFSHTNFSLFVLKKELNDTLHEAKINKKKMNHLIASIYQASKGGERNMRGFDVSICTSSQIINYWNEMLVAEGET